MLFLYRQCEVAELAKLRKYVWSHMPPKTKTQLRDELEAARAELAKV